MTSQSTLITDEELEKALDFLRDNADEIGRAKEYAIRSDLMLKHHKAMAMKMSGVEAIGAQEREAYCTDSYLEAIDRAAEAAGRYEKMKALREAAALKIEAWRSACANYRAMKI